MQAWSPLARDSPSRQASHRYADAENDCMNSHSLDRGKAAPGTGKQLDIAFSRHASSRPQEQAPAFQQQAGSLRPSAGQQAAPYGQAQPQGLRGHAAARAAAHGQQRQYSNGDVPGHHHQQPQQQQQQPEHQQPVMPNGRSTRGLPGGLDRTGVPVQQSYSRHDVITNSLYESRGGLHSQQPGSGYNAALHTHYSSPDPSLEDDASLLAGPSAQAEAPTPASRQRPRSKLADGASVLAEAQQALGLSHVQEAYQARRTPSAYSASEQSMDSPTPSLSASRAGLRGSQAGRSPLAEIPMGRVPPRSHVPLVGDLFDFQQDDSAAGSQSRPLVTSAHLAQEAGISAIGLPHLRMLTREDQEQLVLQDILLAFLGSAGGFVETAVLRASDGPHLAFTFAQQDADEYVCDLACRLLPVCEYAAVIERYAETRMAARHGRVCHALSGALRALLHHWHCRVAQLEHACLANSPPMTLQGLEVYVQQPERRLGLMARLLGQAAHHHLRGAGLLSFLHSQLASSYGNAGDSLQLREVLAAATAPYFSMLEAWLWQGRINDPQHDFMVQQQDGEQDKSTWWERRFTFRTTAQGQPDVPSFLEGCKDAILATGKYVNAIRDCGRSVDSLSGTSASLRYDGQQQFQRAITSVAAQAAGAMLALLKQELGLRSVLQAIKAYQLCGRGDVLTAFMDAAGDTLGQALGGDARHRGRLQRSLQELLDLAVRATGKAGNVGSPALRVTLEPCSHLSAVTLLRAAAGSERASQANFSDLLVCDSLCLHCEVPWPVNVVINGHAQQYYKVAFRHLWASKLVERRLCTAWRTLQCMRPFRWAKGQQAPIAGVTALAVCQRLMHFFRQHLLYETFDVLEPLWRSLDAVLDSGADLDQVMRRQAEFGPRLFQGWMLTRSTQLARQLVDLQREALSFCRLVSRLDAALQPALPAAMPHGASARQLRAAAVQTAAATAIGDPGWGCSMDSVDSACTHKQASFITLLRQEMKATGAEHAVDVVGVAALLDRLNFNHSLTSLAGHTALQATALGQMPLSAGQA